MGSGTHAGAPLPSASGPAAVQRSRGSPESLLAGQFVADLHGSCSATTEGQLIILRPPPPGTISESAFQFSTGLWELLRWKRLASPAGNWGSRKFFQGANYKVFVYPDEYCKCSTIIFNVPFSVLSTLLLCAFVGLNVSHYWTIQRGLGLFLGSSCSSLFEVVSLLFFHLSSIMYALHFLFPICLSCTIFVFQHINLLWHVDLFRFLLFFFFFFLFKSVVLALWCWSILQIGYGFSKHFCYHGHCLIHFYIHIHSEMFIF